MNQSQIALKLLRFLPRLSQKNVVKTPYVKKGFNGVGQYAFLKRRRERGQKGMLDSYQYLPPGYDAQKVPWYIRAPVEDYYRDVTHRRQYPPLSLHELQLLIDKRILNPEVPIDLASLCQTHVYKIDPHDNQYGVNLTSEGIDLFKAKLSIEVQYASEEVIAAVERNGGTIRTAYYDIYSVYCLSDPERFFRKGEPIPLRLTPPPDAIEYYTNAKNRGYLANPEEIARDRLLLAQKYGYDLPDIHNDPMSRILKATKDPRQVFYGLRPGWVVNLKDCKIYEPLRPDLQEYYAS